MIINDYKEEEYVEKKIIEIEEARQLVQVEHPIDFLLALVEGGFFDKKIDYLDIPIIIPTMVWSKFMMRARERNMWRRVVHLPK